MAQRSWRKVWTTTRKDRPGVYVEWTDMRGRRKSKYFNPSRLRFVKTFMARKFTELNSDIRPIGAVIDVPWEEFRREYLAYKRADRLTKSTMAIIIDAIDRFEAITKIEGTGDITDKLLVEFKAAMQQAKKQSKKKNPKPEEKYTDQPLSPDMINKVIRNVAAMLKWGKKKDYIEKNMELKQIKAPERKIRILGNAEIRRLLLACGGDAQWRMRILLGLCTGLRREDIDNIEIGDIDIERNTITALNQKTGKVTVHQPLPEKVIPMLTQFLSDEVEVGQVRLFKHHWSKKWYTIIEKAGLPGLKFHDLRRSFASLQADAGVPIRALQEMLNHASIETTMKHYIQTTESVKRDGVNTLKVEEWI